MVRLTAALNVQEIEIGGQKRLLTNMRDITPHKGAEEEIRSLAEFPEENPDPVIRSSGDGLVLDANQPALRLLGAMGWQASHPYPRSCSGRLDVF